MKLQLPDAPARDGVEGYDLHEIQAALGITKRGVEIRAEKEGWPFTLVPGRGRFGGKRLYRPADLPDEVALALQRRYAPIVPVHPAQTDPSYTRGYGEVGHILEAMRAEAWAYWQRLTGTQRAVGVARWEALCEVQALECASGEIVNGDGVTFDPIWIRFEDGECVKGARRGSGRTSARGGSWRGGTGSGAIRRTGRGCC